MTSRQCSSLAGLSSSEPINISGALSAGTDSQFGGHCKMLGPLSVRSDTVLASSVSCGGPTTAADTCKVLSHNLSTTFFDKFSKWISNIFRKDYLSTFNSIQTVRNTEYSTINQSSSIIRFSTIFRNISTNIRREKEILLTSGLISSRLLH
jgi:hypothetical protein